MTGERCVRTYSDSSRNHLITYSDSWRGWHVATGVRVEELALVLADHHGLVGYLLDEAFAFGFADVKVQPVRQIDQAEDREQVERGLHGSRHRGDFV